jgi:outer membrane protein TolC
MKKLAMLAVIAMVAGTFSGCHDAKKYRDARIKKAHEHFEKISANVPEDDQIFTLVDCVQLAIEHNLDYKVYSIRSKIANERVTAEVLGMLPELNISYDFSGRNNDPGSSSKSIRSGNMTLEPSMSSDRNVSNFKIELALSLIDFGLAYLNATQAEDQALITIEQKRRAAQNLKLEVARTYFKVAATQDARDSSLALLEECKGIHQLLNQLEANKEFSPLRILDERKRFIRLQKQLMEYQRSYDNACIELRALMGYMPTKEVRVDTSFLKDIQVQNLPDVQTLVKVALVERPELYQLDIQANIALNEARKTILTMLPHVRIIMDYQGSDNSFMYNQSWWELAVRAAYNLLKLPQHIATLRTRNSEIEELDARTLALSIGVISQVNIAYANIKEVQERYNLDNEYHQSYLKHLEAAHKAYAAGGNESKLDLARYKLETTDTQIARTIALGNYYLAYYQLLNTVGVETLQRDYIDGIMSKINLAEARAEAKTAKERRASEALAREFEKMYNGVPLGNNTMPEALRSRAEDLVSDNQKQTQL